MTKIDTVAVLKKRIRYKDSYFLIVTDNAAGTRNRYTVYRVPSSPSRKIRVIGREVDLRLARRLCK